MPEKSGPSSIAVRMYNVGFGVCFLLTFRYPAAPKISERHMLIDFGSSAAPRYGPKDYLQRVAEDIDRLSKGKLHVVAATHRHRDHITALTRMAEAPAKSLPLFVPIT